MNRRKPPRPSAQLKAKSPHLLINCGKTTAVPLDQIKKTGSLQKHCSRMHLSRSAKICRNVHRSLAAILAPSSKCWPSSDGRDIGWSGKVNGAVPAGSGVQPLQAWKFRIEHAERTPWGSCPIFNSIRDAEDASLCAERLVGHQDGKDIDCRWLYFKRGRAIRRVKPTWSESDPRGGSRSSPNSDSLRYHGRALSK